jgi:hypothetical protein
MPNRDLPAQVDFSEQSILGLANPNKSSVLDKGVAARPGIWHTSGDNKRLKRCHAELCNELVAVMEHIASSDGVVTFALVLGQTVLFEPCDVCGTECGRGVPRSLLSRGEDPR